MNTLWLYQELTHAESLVHANKPCASLTQPHYGSCLILRRRGCGDLYFCLSRRIRGQRMNEVAMIERICS